METSAARVPANTAGSAGTGSADTPAPAPTRTAAPTVKPINPSVRLPGPWCASTSAGRRPERFAASARGDSRFTATAAAARLTNPCGTTDASSFCPDGRCPWEVRFVNGSGDVFCHGVVVGRKSVLTSAGCMSALPERHVSLAVRDSSAALLVSSWTPHKRYTSGAEDDLAFLELKEPLPEHMSVVPLCLPEKDYSENVLMRAGREGVVMGGVSHSYLSLDDCRDSLNLTFLMTNKMFCMRRAAPRPVSCELKSGSPVATVEGKTAFLTGLSLTAGGCDKAPVFTKLSRYLHWLRPLLLASEK